MAKYLIQIMREDDEFQGLRPIADVIANGMSCITTDIKTEETSNCVELSFEADPETIESSLPDDDFNDDFDDLEEEDDETPLE